MTKRIQKLVLAVAALAALALGGAVFAQAHSAPAAAHHVRHHAVRVSGSETPGTENSEAGPGSESAPGADGPGGHADEPGNASADHQFQGNE
jgi:hypothetical protein